MRRKTLDALRYADGGEADSGPSWWDRLVQAGGDLAGKILHGPQVLDQTPQTPPTPGQQSNRQGLAQAVQSGEDVAGKIIHGPPVLQQPQGPQETMRAATLNQLQNMKPPAAPLPRDYVKDVALAHQVNPEAPLQDVASQAAATAFTMTPEGQAVQLALNPAAGLQGVAEAEAPLVGRVARIENPAGTRVRGTMGGPKGKTYIPLPEDVQTLAQKMQPDNPDAALAQATAALKWNNWDKAAAEKKYGELVRSAPTDPKLVRLQNTPERVQQRIQEAQSFLAKPTEPWIPKDYGIFDRSLIPQAMNGFPDVEQTAFPRTQPTRANLDHIDEIYSDPVNRDLIKTEIARGLPLGGETFYPSLYPVKAEAIARGLESDYFPQTGGDLFDNWIHSVAPGSARNSIYNERAVGNFLRNMTARNIPLTKANVQAEMRAFKQRYGMGLPLMDVHRTGAAQVLEKGISPEDVLQGNLTQSYKIPTYSVQQTGNFAHSWTGDVHEANGETLGSRFNPYFTNQGGFNVNEYGRAEQHMRNIAAEMGLPTGSAQAGRWFGGGELTGLRSPRGDSLDLLERQVAYTLHGMGQPTDPMAVRNYTMKLMQEGGDLLPWFKKGPMPDYRQPR